MSDLKRISIIIATYNAGKFLENALQSIFHQNYTALEVIIIDGNSNDDTLSIIEKYQKSIFFWKSESDDGIYDAWNKGVNNSTGEWIMFLGGDDMLVPDALASYSEFINSLKTEVDLVSSKLLYTDIHMRPFRTMGWKWEWPKSQLEMTIAHPGALHARRLFKMYGKFDTKFKIVGDFEFLLRAGKNLRTAFMDKVTVMFRQGGASDSYAAIFEAFKASRLTGKSSLIRSVLYTSTIIVKYTIRKSLQKTKINVHLRSSSK